jgi:hypothetical protein
MSIPKEPRQLMINLMYLVLTALLALNVSNEILNAFKVINKSINRSNKSLDDKNQMSLASFESASTSPKYTAEKKARILAGFEYAKQVHSMSDSVVAILETYKQDIIKSSGGMITGPDGKPDYKSPENLDAATHEMLPEGKNKSKEMLALLEAYKTNVSALVPLETEDSMRLSGTNAQMAAMLPLEFTADKSEGNPKGDWAFANFHMVPTVGAVTIMDKYINDVRNSEGMVLDEIWARAFGETDVKKIQRQINDNTTKLPAKVEQSFSEYKPFLASASSFILPGEKFTAQVMVGAYNPNDSRTVITVNGQPYRMTDGVANVGFVPSKNGENTVTVGGQYFDANKKQMVPLKPTPFTFFVGSSAASIQLDKMMVFYLGVDNPITVSASGVPFERVKITPSPNLSYVSAGGAVNKYFVRASGAPGTKGTLTLTAPRTDGTTENFGTFTYKIKEIPPPIMYFGNKTGGNLQASIARAQLGPEPRMPVDFEWDVAFKVTSFKIEVAKKGSSDLVTAVINGGSISGNPNAERVMGSLKAGDKLWLSDIKVVGPDKRTRPMPDISFKIF